METKTPSELADEIAQELAQVLRDVFTALSKNAFSAGYEAAGKEARKLTPMHDSQGSDEEKSQ
jgi:cation transport regulator ChaB